LRNVTVAGQSKLNGWPAHQSSEPRRSSFKKAKLIQWAHNTLPTRSSEGSREEQQGPVSAGFDPGPMCGLVSFSEQTTSNSSNRFIKSITLTDKHYQNMLLSPTSPAAALLCADGEGSLCTMNKPKKKKISFFF
jgi:hypothetical protein